ncbi:hypothetical protein HCR17_03865 [Wolbachia pipientis]|nr:hypothetical protein [Wolbachia pipientis]
MNFVSNCQFFSLERCNKAIPVLDTEIDLSCLPYFATPLNGYHIMQV